MVTLFRSTPATDAGSRHRGRGLNRRLPQLLSLVAPALLLGACQTFDLGTTPQPSARPAAEMADGNVITVGRGDSIWAIAQRHAVPMRELIEINQLKPPYKVDVGQKLKLPSTRTYTVQRGDTLSVVARSHNVDSGEIARINNLHAPAYTIRTGQILTLPSQVLPPGTVSAYPSATADSGDSSPAAPGTPWHKPATAPVVETGALAPPATAPAPLRPAATTPPAQSHAVPLAGVSSPPPSLPPSRHTAPAAVPAPAPSKAPAAAAPVVLPAVIPSTPATPPPPQTAEPEAPRAGARFSWPIKGKLLSGFGAKSDGRHNDGVNVAAHKGVPVNAADNGVVAYAGSELRGYGNLVLLRHADGWMTAYAHLDQISVERGAQVKRGQRIGTVGSSGTVNEPQLHFEVRKGSQPVDPADYLEGPPS